MQRNNVKTAINLKKGLHNHSDSLPGVIIRKYSMAPAWPAILCTYSSLTVSYPACEWRMLPATWNSYCHKFSNEVLRDSDQHYHVCR